MVPVPVTRSKAVVEQSTVADATPPVSTKAVTAPLARVLANLDDASTVHGRDAKELKEATTEALIKVWKDAKKVTAQLAEHVNQGNSNLLNGLNGSFAAIGSRIEQIPLVATCCPDGLSSRVTPFAGTSSSQPFSLWLRRLEDSMRRKILTSQDKANYLVAHLESVARERVETLSAEDKVNYEALVNRLRTHYEGPKQRAEARQALTTCRQERGESSSTFAFRLLNLLRNATGRDPTLDGDLFLQEFTQRLHADLRFHVRFAKPASFEEALAEAERVEQLLSEASAGRLIHPSHPQVPVAVSSVEPIATSGPAQIEYAFENQNYDDPHAWYSLIFTVISAVDEDTWLPNVRQGDESDNRQVNPLVVVL